MRARNRPRSQSSTSSPPASRSASAVSPCTTCSDARLCDPASVSCSEPESKSNNPMRTLLPVFAVFGAPVQTSGDHQVQDIPEITFQVRWRSACRCASPVPRSGPRRHPVPAAPPTAAGTDCGSERAPAGVQLRADSSASTYTTISGSSGMCSYCTRPPTLEVWTSPLR